MLTILDCKYCNKLFFKHSTMHKQGYTPDLNLFYQITDFLRLISGEIRKLEVKCPKCDKMNKFGRKNVRKNEQ